VCSSFLVDEHIRRGREGGSQLTAELKAKMLKEAATLAVVYLVECVVAFRVGRTACESFDEGVTRMDAKEREVWGKVGELFYDVGDDEWRALRWFEVADRISGGFGLPRRSAAEPENVVLARGFSASAVSLACQKAAASVFTLVQELSISDFSVALSKISMTARFIGEGMKVTRDEIAHIQAWMRANQPTGDCMAELLADLDIGLDTLLDLDDTLQRTRSLFESEILMVRGKALLDLAVGGEEELRMELVYDCLDHFRSALELVKEKNIEIEAKITSAIGNVFHKVIKDNQAAKQMFKNAVELVHSFKLAGDRPGDWRGPRPGKKNSTTTRMEVDGEDEDDSEEDDDDEEEEDDDDVDEGNWARVLKASWYKEATEALRKMQEIAKTQDDAEYQRMREPLILELAPELKAIRDAAEKGSVPLLKHIYAKHAPDGAPALDEKKLGSGDLKRTLLKAIVLWHPDQARKRNQSAKTIVLNEEIVKALNAKYECFKG
jgi:hypothetical protein